MLSPKRRYLNFHDMLECTDPENGEYCENFKLLVVVVVAAISSLNVTLDVIEIPC